MKVRITPYSVILTIFILTEAAIYIAFNAIAASGGNDPIYLKYASVLVCLAFAGGMCYFCGRDGIVLTVALAFTAFSDYFILVLDDLYELGVSTFIITQCAYLYRLYADRRDKLYISLSVRVLLVAILLTVLKLYAVLDFLVAVVATYIVMLFVNMAEALTLARLGYKNTLFALGMVLFFCCDICVGLNNFESVLGIELSRGLLAFVSYAMWAFYLPSQVCIVCSARRGGLKIRRQLNAEKSS